MKAIRKVARHQPRPRVPRPRRRPQLQLRQHQIRNITSQQLACNCQLDQSVSTGSGPLNCTNHVSMLLPPSIPRIGWASRGNLWLWLHVQEACFRKCGELFKLVFQTFSRSFRTLLNRIRQITSQCQTRYSSRSEAKLLSLLSTAKRSSMLSMRSYITSWGA